MRTHILLTTAIVVITSGPVLAVTLHEPVDGDTGGSTGEEGVVVELRPGPIHPIWPGPPLDCFAGTPLCIPPTDNCAADGPNCPQIAPDPPGAPTAPIPLPPAIGALLAGIAALAGLAMRRRAA